MPRDSDDEDDDRPRRRRRPRDDDEDEEDERPRHRRRDEKGDATGGLIPYKNSQALIAYYCGVFSLIPGLGCVLGIVAVVLGVMGLQYAKKNPKAKGTGHAITGIVLGVVGVLVVPAIGVALLAMSKK